jgi:Putative Ig domain
LGFNTSTGAISGTPTVSGTFNFTAKVTDSLSATATGSFSITINTVLAVTTASLPSGTQGTSYASTNLSASGGILPYSWSITVGSLPAGMNLTGNTISGIPTVSGTFPITVQVADAASGTATANFSIVIAPAPPLAVTTTSGALPAGTLNIAYPSTNLSASGGIQPYTWSITVGALPTGLNLNTSTGAITGTPTASGTFNFTAQVKDSVAATATAALSITVAATSSCTTLTGQESLLKGDYAFVLKGFDASGNPALVGGVFVAGGVSGAGNITAGTLDMNLVGGVQSGLSFTSASTYNLGQDSTGGFRGCMTIVTSAGTQHYRFSVDGVTAGTASNGHVIDFDTTGPFTTGILRQATSSAFSTGAVAGSWAFGVSGERSVASGGGKFAAVGVLTLAGGSASGVADTNDHGTLDGNNTLTDFPATPVTLSSGPYSIAANGRGSLQFTPSGSTSAVTNIVYVVSSSEVLILNSDSQTGSAAFSGRALKQSGTLSNSSLNANTTDVLYDSGLGSTAGTSRVEFGLIATTGASANFTFSGYHNDGGSISDPTNNSGSGTYSVASDGRVTLTFSGGGGGGGNNHPPVFYLSSANTAFFLSSDGGIGSGFVEPQSGSSFTNSSASGAYGIGVIDPDVSGVSDESGMLTFTPSTTSISGTSDKNSQGTLTPDNALSVAYAINSTGVGLIPSGCTLAGAGANCENLFIVISPKKVVLMKVKPTSTTPAINVLEQ